MRKGLINQVNFLRKDQKRLKVWFYVFNEYNMC